MARSSQYGFVFKRHLTPGIETPATLEYIISNSAGALTVGDAVYLSSGYLMGAGADQAILGILVGFVTKNGENIFKTEEAISGSKSGDDTYNAAADNQTVDQVRGVVIVDTMALFQAHSDTALVAADVGTFFNGGVADGTYVDSVVDSGSGAWSVGTQQFQLIERVTTLEDGSASTTAGLFRIIRSQLVHDVTQGAS
jgi:hypothetical protein